MTENSQKIVVCAVIHKDKRIFIAKRAATKKFLPNQWELPGGHVEFGETLEEALHREVKEELNLIINVGSIYTAFTYFTDHKETHEVEIVFFATLANLEQEPQLNVEDHSEYRWVTREEAEDLLDPANLETRVVTDAFVRLG